MSKPKVVIIILQYNNSQDTIRCLNSVKELDYPNYNILVVDNASSLHYLNSTRLFIENEKKGKPATYGSTDSPSKDYSLLTTHYNSGYAGGNNLGIKKALKNGADYFFILNPDTTVEKNSLTNLVEVGESDPQIGILGPKINEGNRTIYGGKIEWLKPKLQHSELPTTNYQLPTTFYIPGAAMLIKKEVIKKIGLLDERYFLYFEDADYCVLARKADYELVIVPEARVDHAVSTSTNQLGSALLLRYHFRNAHLFNLKNGPWYVKLALPFWSFFIIIKQLIKLALGRNTQISKAILSGVLDFYKNNLGKIET